MGRFHLRLLNRQISLPESGAVVVGRDASCDVVIDDDRASRRHATFRMSGRSVSVEDNGSTNGVRVNDVSVREPRSLSHGDRVEIGTHVFIVMDAERGRSVPTKSGVAMTRRVAVATIPRSSGSLLETIARAIELGDLAAAAREMDLLAPRYASGETDVDVAQVVSLLLKLAMQPRCERFLDRCLQIHASRGAVPTGEAIDAVNRALPALGAAGTTAVEQYLTAMSARVAALPVGDRVRLRRLEALARPVRRAGA